MNTEVMEYQMRAAADTTRHPYKIIPRQLANGILRRGGFPVEGLADPMSLRDVCREALYAETGIHVGVREDYVIRAVSSVHVASAFTLSVNATLAHGWDSAPDSSDWVNRTSPNNFKVNSRVTIDQVGGLVPLPVGGTAKHLSVNQLREATYKMGRFARTLVIDEMDIIDDNIELITTTPFLAGQQAKQLKPDLVYRVVISNENLSDSVPLFHSSRGNTGTADLDDESLSAACDWMQSQRDASGRVFAVKPTHLVVGTELEDTARALLVARAAEGIDNLQLRVESRLTTAYLDPEDIDEQTMLTPLSEGSWLLVAAGGPNIEFGSRTEQPETRTSMLSGGMWGFAWDIAWDVQACAVEPRSMFLSVPAA